MPASPDSRAASPDPIVLVGALHVDELYWPIGPPVMRASNPVRRARRVGGVAANVARAAREASGASRPVVLCAALGEDADARWLADTLAAADVDCRGVTVPGRASGRYAVVHDGDGELLLGLSDVDVAEALEADAVHEALASTRAAALVLDANLSPACLASLLERAEPSAAKSSASTSAPAPAPASTSTSTPADVPRVALAVSPAKATRFAPHLASLDLLLCNRREAAALGGLDADAPIEALVDALAAAGAARFVLSDGGDPVRVRTPDAHRVVAVPPVAIAGSVNGAGDALAGATIAHWLEHGDLERAVREAGLPAARTVLSSPPVP